MIIEGNKIMPSEGYKYVTNGETYSELVYLGIHDSVDNWHDTNDEPPEPPTSEPNPDYEQSYGYATYDSLEQEVISNVNIY